MFRPFHLKAVSIVYVQFLSYETGNCITYSVTQIFIGTGIIIKNKERSGRIEISGRFIMGECLCGHAV